MEESAITKRREKMTLGEVIRSHYANDLNDYWIPPLVSCKDGVAEGRVCDGDTVIFCCRRGEREIQLMESFVEKSFSEFETKAFNDLRFLPLVQYHKKFTSTKSIIPATMIDGTLGEAISRAGLKQLAVTESEKEAHVTFFFNGRRNSLYMGQVAQIIPSWKDFKAHPEMKSSEIGIAVERSMDRYDFVIVNFPAGDVIGHLQDMNLKIKAAEEIDRALGSIYNQAKSLGTTLIITADHGLMEKGITEEGVPSVSHTTAPVPFVVVNDRLKRNTFLEESGSLADVAPTILALLGLEKPVEMTGNSLIARPLMSSSVVLVILDGWGEGEDNPLVNPLKAAKTPVLDFLRRSYPHTTLKASEEAVGLPSGRSGNSETGHLTIGAGRVIEQDELRIERAIVTGFRNEKVLKDTIESMRESSSLHLIGLLSEASSHGNTKEMLAILDFARSKGVEKIYGHLILDGRSAPPRSALDLLEKYNEDLKKMQIVTVLGRGYALDRSRDYTGKTKLFYDALVYGRGECY
jgi:2,3-bisphosphoglycerate-independent phosphoglycerate mutase